jgi:biotin transport system permease protein
MVHRAPLRAKYAVLLILTTTLMLWREPVVIAVILALVFTLYAAASLPREFLKPWRSGWVVLVFAGLARWVSGIWGPASLSPVEAIAPAAVVMIAVFGALASARLLIISTPGTELLDGLERFFGMLGPLGVNPQASALGVNVMLRSIPWIAGAVLRNAEALASRGLRRRPLRLMAPVLVATVGHARATGEALTARGLPSGLGDERRQERPAKRLH